MGLKHGVCGSPPVAEVYGWSKDDLCLGRDGLGPLQNDEALTGRHGPTVTFNLLRPDGRYVGYEEVIVLRIACDP